MSKRFLYFLLLAVVVLSAAGGVFAQDSTIELSISGVNGADALQWLNDMVVPAFEQKMADEGKDVSVTVIPFSGTGEDLRQQYALDLGVGQGADVLSFDGFWIPEFADGGLVKPLTEIVGPQVMDWEGWSVIPEGLQQILGYNGQALRYPLRHRRTRNLVPQRPVRAGRSAERLAADELAGMARRRPHHQGKAAGRYADSVERRYGDGRSHHHAGLLHGAARRRQPRLRF